MPNQHSHTPIEVMQNRGVNGKTLGGRDIEVHDVGGMQRHEPPPYPDGLWDRGKTEWDKIWRAGPWLWLDQDYAWVEQVARAYDDIAQFRATVNDEGLTVQGYNGQTVAHPLIAEIRKAEQTIQKCLSQIGFSPSDRARLKLAELKGAQAAKDLLGGDRGGKKDSGSAIPGYVEDQW